MGPMGGGGRKKFTGNGNRKERSLHQTQRRKGQGKSEIMIPIPGSNRGTQEPLPKLMLGIEIQKGGMAKREGRRLVWRKRVRAERSKLPPGAFRTSDR